MIPDKVQFTGLEIDPQTIIEPRKKFSGVYPAEWVRHQFMLEHETYPSLRKIDRWMEKTMEGRWGSYTDHGFDGTIVVIAFERVTDAVMFRLAGGEKAWMEE